MLLATISDNCGCVEDHVLRGTPSLPFYRLFKNRLLQYLFDTVATGCARGSGHSQHHGWKPRGVKYQLTRMTRQQPEPEAVKPPNLRNYLPERAPRKMAVECKMKRHASPKLVHALPSPN